MKSKFLRRVLVGLLSTSCLLSMVGCSDTSSDNPTETESESASDEKDSSSAVKEYLEDEAVALANAKNIGIHDPSIFYDPVSGNYYSYGSHMVAGKSKDMASWEYICNSGVGTNSLNKIFAQDFRDEFAEVFEWLDITKDRADFGIWALDVTYSQAAADAGKDPYFMYVSLVNGTTQSAIALATASSPEGPFAYAGTIVCADFRESDVAAGHTNLLEVLGKNSVSDMSSEEKDFYFTADTAEYKSKFVDCIDAAPFYDGEGNFYMVYGSFSSQGGIRILKMDPITGLRSDDNYDYTDDGRQDPYYGKQIAKKRGEGPYILVVESDQSSTGYYYFLFWSQGVLRSTGGYNMRMLRSEYPDHGYVDYAGNDAFSDASTTALGVRIMDNFQFTSMKYSSTANGGNSAIIREDGKMFLHYHSKSAHSEAYGENGFVIKSNQMFLNEDGWLVVAPYKYGGESIRPLTTEDVVGDYEFIYHRLQYYSDPVNFNDNFVSSEPITLNADGTVTGAYEGTWKLEETYFTITIDGNEYKGVALQQYDESDTRVYTTVFTASGTDNRTVWGSKISSSIEERIMYDMDNTSIITTATTDFTLPTVGRLNTAISWESSDESIVIDGNIARVTCQDTQRKVTLSANFSLGEIKTVKRFTVTVPAEEYNIPETISSTSIELPKTTATGAAITWKSSDSSIINVETGVVTIPKKSVVVTLTGTVEGSDRTISVDVTVMPTPTKVVYEENFDGIAAIDASDTNSLWYSTNAAGSLTLQSDGNGKYVQFAPGSANSRGAISKLPLTNALNGIYQLDFDLKLTAGNNQTTEFAVTTENLTYSGVINDGISAGYLFKLSANNSTTWAINDGDTFEIAADTWVHVSALADTASGKVVVTITDNSGNTIYSGTVAMNSAGALQGFYIRGGRYNSVTCVDNVVIKAN